ncbi:protoporphyrinogen/coproporphyrinogen oxidase [Actinomadura hibisca]|uniref:protoporphyrinogen/coproporphyrinogen oxidase n=1 Tax=Actinomadura hibisca TaxID=68565 RepID=UPI000A07B8B7|nr:NAD(P)/FAD-dependent oxidoreductase [Actinomadura hibisca]
MPQIPRPRPVPTTEPPDSSPAVLVVGAGIAGLTAAWRLSQAGVSVEVLEKERWPGGRMATLDHDGFRIELGASILGTNYTRMLDLITELGLQQQFGPANTTCAFLRDGRVHHLRAHRPDDLLRSGLLGPRSKLALARLVPTLIAQRHRLDWRTMDRNTVLDRSSVTEYARRHLTPELLEQVCEPLFGGGIVLGSPDELAAADMFFYAAKLLVPHFNSPHGVGLLTRTLADRLPVRLGAAVSAVRHDGDGVSVTWTDADGTEHTRHAAAAIVAVPAPHVPGLVPGLSRPVARLLSAIPYSRGLVVSFGLRHPPPQTAPILFTARGTNPDLAGLELHHNKIAGRVAPGRGLITAHLRKDSAHRWWDLDDDAVTERTLTAVARIFPGIDGTVLTSHVNRRDPALVVRPPGGYAALRELNAHLEHADPTVQLAGDYFGPSSTYGALLSGEHAARRTLRRLRSNRPPRTPDAKGDALAS